MVNTCYWLGTALGDGNKRIKDIILVYKFLQSLRFYTRSFMGKSVSIFFQMHNQLGREIQGY